MDTLQFLDEFFDARHGRLPQGSVLITRCRLVIVGLHHCASRSKGRTISLPMFASFIPTGRHTSDVRRRGISRAVSYQQQLNPLGQCSATRMTAIDAVATQTLACLRVLPLTGDSIHTGLLAENRQERPLLGRSEPFQFFTGATAPVIEQGGREGSTAVRAPKQRAKGQRSVRGASRLLGTRVRSSWLCVPVPCRRGVGLSANQGASAVDLMNKELAAHGQEARNLCTTTVSGPADVWPSAVVARADSRTSAVGMDTCACAIRTPDIPL